MGREDPGVYWIWLQTVLGCGSHRTNAVCARFKSARELYEAGQNKRRESRCFTAGELQRLERTPLAGARAVYERCRALGCRVITPEDDAFPERLRNIYAMPAALYVLGDLRGIDSRVAITMVGTRGCTGYGRRAGELLARQLARWGAVVISGLALGIDTVCLRAAMEEKGRCVGVLGCGIDICYPQENAALIAHMARHHAVVTEYPPGTRPLGRNFPVRNRILAGLGLGTVVVEAGQGSGALITAAHALEQGKDIFAVPGRIDDTASRGPLSLIQQGAKLVCSAEDILAEYETLYPQELAGLSAVQLRGQQAGGGHSVELPLGQRPGQHEGPAPPPARPTLPAEADEGQRAVYALLSCTPASAQELARRAGLPVGTLLPILTELELMGVARQQGMNRYSLAQQGE